MINKYKLHVRNETSIFEIFVDIISVCIATISEEAGEMRRNEQCGEIK